MINAVDNFRFSMGELVRHQTDDLTGVVVARQRAVKTTGAPGPEIYEVHFAWGRIAGERRMVLGKALEAA